MDISGVPKVVLGFVGLGGLSVLIYYLLSLLKKSPSEIIKQLKEEKEALLKEKIENIKKKEPVIIDKIKESEKASEETRTKVSNTVHNVIKDVNKILQEDKISDIDKVIKDDWKNL